MWLLISAFLGLIVAVLAWVAISLQADLQSRIIDNQALYKQLRECNNQRIKDSIEVKAAAWRRDRRASDKPWGMTVSHEDD